MQNPYGPITPHERGRALYNHEFHRETTALLYSDRLHEKQRKRREEKYTKVDISEVDDYLEKVRDCNRRELQVRQSEWREMCLTELDTRNPVVRHRGYCPSKKRMESLARPKNACLPKIASQSDSAASFITDAPFKRASITASYQSLNSSVSSISFPVIRRDTLEYGIGSDARLAARRKLNEPTVTEMRTVRSQSTSRRSSYAAPRVQKIPVTYVFAPHKH